MDVVLYAIGLILFFLWLVGIDSKSAKEKEARLAREWDEQNLGAPMGHRRPDVGPFTEAHLRDQGYSEREIEFMMHNFGDKDATN